MGPRNTVLLYSHIARYIPVRTNIWLVVRLIDVQINMNVHQRFVVSCFLFGLYIYIYIPGILYVYNTRYVLPGIYYNNSTCREDDMYARLLLIGRGSTVQYVTITRV